MPKQRGGRVAMPIEYYGVNSGKYSSSKLSGVCANAYGNTLPLSHGTIHPNGLMTGPNMHFHPGSLGPISGQTGGGKKKAKSRGKAKRGKTKSRGKAKSIKKKQPFSKKNKSKRTK